MKKYTKFLFVFMVFVLVLQTGCFKKSIDIDDVDWEKKIEADFLSDSSDIGEAIADAVSVRVEMEDDIISVIIKAPDIYDALVEWIEDVMSGRFTEDALDEKIIELIEEIEPVKTTHTFTYEMEDDKVVVEYDKDFENAIHCGLDYFYEELDEKEKDGEWIILDDASDRQNDTVDYPDETKPDETGMIETEMEETQQETRATAAVDAQRGKIAEKMTIELNWDGISGTGKLINLDIYLNGETEDGDYVSVSTFTPEAYVDGELIAELIDNSTENEHAFKILIYDTRGKYTLEANPTMNEDGMIISGEVMSSEIEATVWWNGDREPVMFDLDTGLFRSYTGVWVWMPFAIDYGEVVEPEGY